MSPADLHQAPQQVPQQAYQPNPAYAHTPAPTYSAAPTPLYPSAAPVPQQHYAAPPPPPAAPQALPQYQQQQQQQPAPAAYAYSPAPEPSPSATATGPIAVMTKEQHKFGVSLLRTLKKNRSAPPFLRPVDPVAQLIPDYFRVITRPMDLGTVEAKLSATGKALTAANKAGRTFGIDYTGGTGAWEGASDKVYRTAEDFKEDVERIWTNCYRYNGPKEKNPVSAMAAAMQEVCERMWRTMPSAPPVEVSLLPLPLALLLRARPTMLTLAPRSLACSTSPPHPVSTRPSNPRRNVALPTRSYPPFVDRRTVRDPSERFTPRHASCLTMPSRSWEAAARGGWPVAARVGRDA